MKSIPWDDLDLASTPTTLPCCFCVRPTSFCRLCVHAYLDICGASYLDQHGLLRLQRLSLVLLLLFRLFYRLFIFFILTIRLGLRRHNVLELDDRKREKRGDS